MPIPCELNKPRSQNQSHAEEAPAIAVGLVKCAKFAFECQYLPSPSYKKKATPKPIETSKATLHSDQRSDQRRDGQLQNNAKDAQLQSESDFSEDIFSSAFLFGHDATTSDARELLGHIDEDEFDFNGQILFSSQCDSPVGLDWGSQASLSEVSGSASTVSPINTTILSPPCPPASAKDNLDYDRPPFLSFHAVPNVGDIHFVRRDSVAGDSLPQGIPGDTKSELLNNIHQMWSNKAT
ncbi:hypothetical protein BJ166DRAFT_491828 [Pestalotiopsis sp. NC0098]|nr:hypothetical protein BJ166DRAFT_491828 [Pestalotiopsis sp. NC0098]